MTQQNKDTKMENEIESFINLDLPVENFGDDPDDQDIDDALQQYVPIVLCVHNGSYMVYAKFCKCKYHAMELKTWLAARKMIKENENPPKYIHPPFDVLKGKDNFTFIKQENLKDVISNSTIIYLDYYNFLAKIEDYDMDQIKINQKERGHKHTPTSSKKIYDQLCDMLISYDDDIQRLHNKKQEQCKNLHNLNTHNLDNPSTSI